MVEAHPDEDDAGYSRRLHAEKGNNFVVSAVPRALA